ncbi:MAG TPA: GNAT family N-acetyltransferase, partial [Hyphomicrobiaceae bacterium]|nr:GNAT family N-acetyltransferase [Hyphomicrobiaceae bacterium]
PITVEHVDGFREALDLVARERKYLAMLEAPPIEQVRAFVMNNIQNANPHLVMMDTNRVVGWCDIVRKNQAIHAHAGVLGMGIRPEYRGQGLGKHLLSTALAQAWHTLRRVELTVRADNSRAIALYENAGFIKEGEMRDAVRIDGIYTNLLLMAILGNARREA